MLCYTTLTGISTSYTYFDRYQDAWDVMVTVKDTEINNFAMIQQVKDTEGVGEATVYQRAEEKTFIRVDEQSEELIELGGLENIASSKRADNGFWVNTQIVILDDSSFMDYCSQLGIPQSLDGAIVLNQIWDSVNSNF